VEKGGRVRYLMGLAREGKDRNGEGKGLNRSGCRRMVNDSGWMSKQANE